MRSSGGLRSTRATSPGREVRQSRRSRSRGPGWTPGTPGTDLLWAAESRRTPLGRCGVGALHGHWNFCSMGSSLRLPRPAPLSLAGPQTCIAGSGLSPPPAAPSSTPIGASIRLCTSNSISRLPGVLSRQPPAVLVPRLLLPAWAACPHKMEEMEASPYREGDVPPPTVSRHRLWVLWKSSLRSSLVSPSFSNGTCQSGLLAQKPRQRLRLCRSLGP